LVYGVVHHYFLSWCDTIFAQSKEVEPAVYYFLSRATAECVRATLLCVGIDWPTYRSWIRPASKQFDIRDIPGRNDSKATGSEEFEVLMKESNT
jgi:hypothetical protein